MTYDSFDPEGGENTFNEPETATATKNTTPIYKRKWVLVAAGSIVLVAIIATSIAVPLSKNSSAAAASGRSSTNAAEDQSTVSRASEFRFNAALPAFGDQVLNGYDSCDDLTTDIEIALKNLADYTIEQQKDTQCWWSDYPDYMYGDDGVEASGMQAAAPTSDSGGESSFGTNNQVEGVDEADLVKSDGERIFVGYGNEVIVTDLDGNILTRMKVPEIEKQETGTNDTSVEETTDDTTAQKVAAADSMMYYPGPTTRRVESLLLHNNIVTAITHYDNWQCDSAICGGNTTAFIYEFDPDAESLTLLSQVDINGYYSNARSIGSYAHIVTNANVNTWEFTQPLYRCNEVFKNMTTAEYEEAAFKIASNTVEEYAQKIMKGLSWTQSTNGTTSCENIIQISSMTNQDSVTMSQRRGLSWYNDQGFLQNFVQLTSFDVEQGSMAGIKSSAAGAFIAAYSPEMYATEDTLVLANRGYWFDPSAENGAGSYSEYTYLMTFDLAGAVATPHSVGEVDGYLNNQFSIDYNSGFYRVATTNSQKWTSFMNDQGYYEWKVGAESTSQVYVLEEQSSKLEVVGSVKDLGKGETIQSVRFFGDKGYVVTFRQVDPLYVIDFSSPTKPKVSSELKVTGFSSYMHPIKDGRFLLTFGQEADTDGTITGMKISVFNVTNSSEPFEQQKYVVENGNGWSSSDVMWDSHAFRYLDESEKLIIPASIYNWQSPEKNFDGFFVYDIDVVNGIELAGTVTHADSNAMESYCWRDAYLPSRSMVFSGELVTFKGHSIAFSDLYTLQTQMWVNLDEDLDKSKDNCYNYLW